MLLRLHVLVIAYSMAACVSSSGVWVCVIRGCSGLTGGPVWGSPQKAQIVNIVLQPYLLMLLLGLIGSAFLCVSGRGARWYLRSGAGGPGVGGCWRGVISIIAVCGVRYTKS